MERYSFERAENEARKMEDKIKEDGILSYSDVEKLVEAENKNESFEQVKNAKVFIYAGGCTSNWVDAGRVINYLEQNDHEIVHLPTDADVIIMNICSVDKIAEDGTSKKIESVTNDNPNAKLIIMGCLQDRIINKYSNIASISKADLNRFDEIFEHANISIADTEKPSEVAAPAYWTSIEKYVAGDVKSFRSVFPSKEIVTEDEEDPEVAYLKNLNANAWIINTSEGCMGNCSYCGIKRNRGVLKSATLERLSEEFKVGLKRGKDDFKIWGDDVGDYGKDIGTNVAELLCEFLKNNDEFKMEVLAANPRSFLELYDKLLPSLMDKRIERFNVPIQSGSEEILGRMHRKIDIEKFIDRINELRQKAPHLTLLTHYMVGFPGETEENFQETIEFAHRTRMYQGLFMIFDAKDGTRAAGMLDQISPEVKKDRHDRLKSICQEGADKFYNGIIY